MLTPAARVKRPWQAPIASTATHQGGAFAPARRGSSEPKAGIQQGELRRERGSLAPSRASYRPAEARKAIPSARQAKAAALVPKPPPSGAPSHRQPTRAAASGDHRHSRHQLDRPRIPRAGEIFRAQTADQPVRGHDGEARRDPAQAQAAPRAGIAGRKRHIGDQGVDQVEPEEHVGLEEEAIRKRLDPDPLERPGVDGGVAVGGVADPPIAGGGLVEHREGPVAGAAGGRHRPQRPRRAARGHQLGRREAVALAIIGFALDDRGDQAAGYGAGPSGRRRRA